MTPIASIAALSIGHALEVQTADVGVVHSVFARAVNLFVGAEMWTLLADGKADLPFGIRVPFPDFGKLDLRPGDPVNVRSGFVGAGSHCARLVVDCRAARRWVPVFDDGPEPGMERRLAVVASVARERSWRDSAAMALRVRTAMGDELGLGAAAANVVGCGPGATPAGDDVLVGILAVITSPHSGAAGARAATSLGRSIIPLLSTTTDISAQLLRQATRGLFGRDVHELISALIGDPDPWQLRENVRRVVETGATSGADTCEGVLAFAPSFLLPHHERAAA